MLPSSRTRTQPDAPIRRGRGGSARHSRLAFGDQAHTKGRREGQYFTPTQAADLNCVLHSTSLWQRGGWRGVLWSHAPPSRPWQCTFGPRDPHLSQQGHWPDPLPIHPSLPRLSLPHPSGSLYCAPQPRGPASSVLTVIQWSVTPAQSRLQVEVGEGSTGAPQVDLTSERSTKNSRNNHHVRLQLPQTRSAYSVCF